MRLNKYKFIYIVIFFSLLFGSLKAQLNVNLNIGSGVNLGYKVRAKDYSHWYYKGAYSVSGYIGGDLRYLFNDSKTICGVGLNFLYQPYKYKYYEYHENWDFSTFTKKSDFFFLTVPVYFGRQKPSGFKWYIGTNLKFILLSISANEKLLPFSVSKYTVGIKKFNYGLLLGMEFHITEQLNIGIKTDIEIPGFFFYRMGSAMLGNWNTMVSIGYKINFK